MGTSPIFFICRKIKARNKISTYFKMLTDEMRDENRFMLISFQMPKLT